MTQLTEKMRSLDIMKDEMREQVAIPIQARLIQVQGDLYEYNPLEDKNVERVKDVWLCVDQKDKWGYMLNVVDGKGKVSYTRKDIGGNNVSDFQLDKQNQGICFIGQPRKNKYIPGYFFKLSSAKDFESMSGILAKCMFESQSHD